MKSRHTWWWFFRRALRSSARRPRAIPLDDMANKLMRRLLPFNSPALSLVRAGD
jgi:hypothetical protein